MTRRPPLCIPRPCFGLNAINLRAWGVAPNTILLATSGRAVRLMSGSEERAYLVQFNQRYSRISKLFQGSFDGQHYRSMVRYLDSEFKRPAADLQAETTCFEAVRSTPNDLETILRLVLPEDSTTFQWGPMYGGIVGQVSDRFSALYNEFIVRHENQAVREYREEYQIWSDFEKRLKARELFEAVQPQTIENNNYPYNFKGSFTNGELNVLEPISFDLIDPTSIVEKANTWVGRLSTLQRGQEFVFNGILAAPNAKSRLNDFERAMKILRSLDPLNTWSWKAMRAGRPKPFLMRSRRPLGATGENLESLEVSLEPILRSLILKRFRSIPAETVSFDNPTFLVGQNGSGKSNFVDVFAFLAEAMASPLQGVFDRRGGISPVRNRSSGQSHPPNQ